MRTKLGICKSQVVLQETAKVVLAIEQRLSEIMKASHNTHHSRFAEFDAWGLV